LHKLAILCHYPYPSTESLPQLIIMPLFVKDCCEAADIKVCDDYNKIEK